MLRWVPTLLGAATLAACTAQVGNGGERPLPALRVQGPSRAPGAYIKHVVLVIQENRTLNDVFAGFPGADTKMSGLTHTGATVALRPVPFRPDQDMNHDYTPAYKAVDGGKMDGFDLVTFNGGQPAKTYPYAFLPRDEVVPYWTMARGYTLVGHMFPTELGPSFTSHLSLIAGTTTLSIDPPRSEANVPSNSPWGCDAPPETSTQTVNAQRVIRSGPFPCFNQFRTLADVLDTGGISWTYYAPALSANYGGALWSTFDAIQKVRYGADWSHVVSPQTTVLKDAAKRRLAQMNWVVPDWLDSDHPAAESDTGPSWVASVVNAIGRSPDWSSTAIIVLWDDWGGWYDNVPPPQLDYRGLGIRVPCILISPYARAHTVVHTQYEFGSILRFIEQTFGLPTIGTVAQGYTDARARSLANAFDFTQRPRRFVPIAQKYSAEYFLTRPASGRPVDNQ
jgi:phospholipase C